MEICKNCYHPLELHDDRRETKYCDVVLVNMNRKRDGKDWYCECPGYEEL